MDLALNNLQRLICDKTQQTNQPTWLMAYHFRGLFNAKAILVKEKYWCYFTDGYEEKLYIYFPKELERESNKYHKCYHVFKHTLFIINLDASQTIKVNGYCCIVARSTLLPVSHKYKRCPVS